MEYLCLLMQHTACFELAKGCPIFQRRDVSKNSMDEEDVVTDVLTKLFFCGSDVPDVKLFSVFLWLKTKEDVMVIEPCVVAEQNNEISVFIN